MPLRDILINEEGWKSRTYPDQDGNHTWGAGHLDPHSPLGEYHTDEEISLQLDTDIATATNAVAKALPWTASMDRVRREALVDMAFQMGAGKLLGFRNMLAWLQAGQFVEASKEALNSAWARQTPGRAAGVAKRLATGVE